MGPLSSKQHQTMYKDSFRELEQRSQNMYQNNQGLCEIASIVRQRRRLLMFSKSSKPVVFNLGKWSRRFRVRLHNKHRFDIVPPNLWIHFYIDVGLQTHL